MGSTQSWIFDKLQLFKVKKLNNTLSRICHVSLFAFSTRNYARLSIELWYLNTVIEMEEHWESQIRASPISSSISESIHRNVRIIWYWCAWIWHLVLKWPSDRKWNNIVVTSSWGLLFDLSLNWTTYPGTNGQKMDQAVMILMLLKRIRNFKLEPFTIPNCLPNSDVHHQLFPTYSLSQLTLRSGDCKS